MDIISKSLSSENIIVCFKSNFMSLRCFIFKHEILMSLPCDALVKASVAFMVMMMVICFVVDWSDLCVTELYVGLSAVCLSLGGGGGVP